MHERLELAVRVRAGPEHACKSNLFDAWVCVGVCSHYRSTCPSTAKLHCYR